MITTLETERLILRAWKEQDVTDFYEYAQDELTGPMAGWKPHESIEESRKIIKDFIEKKCVFAIEYKENKKVIGSFGLHKDAKRDEDINVLMIGYVLSRQYWGNGLITEAAKAVIEYAFDVLKCDMLSVYHYENNMRSRRVIEKCGFRYEGRLRMASKLFDGTTHDDCCYSLTRGEYYSDMKNK